MRDARCLDREALGRLAFWREFPLTASGKGNIRILTHRKDVDQLPIDLKLLLQTVPNDDKKVGAMLGSVPVTRNSGTKFSVGSLSFLMIGLTTLVKILSIRKLYRFNVSKDSDGTIAIEAVPIGA